MKNKKGISIGRILLYVLFLSLIALFIWTLYVTFKAMKKKDHVDNSVHSSLRMVDNNSSVVRNLYNIDAYPFQNKNLLGNDDAGRVFTGCYIFLPTGTYSMTFDSSLFNTYKYAIICSSVPGLNVLNTLTFGNMDIYYTTSTYTFTLSVDSYFGIYISKQDWTAIFASDLNNYDYMLVSGSTPQSYVAYDSSFVNATSYITNSYFLGSASWTMDEFFGNYNVGAGFYDVYYPVSGASDSGSISGSSSHYVGNKTNFNVTSYNSSDLFIGSNISSLYSSINNANWTIYYYTYHVSRSYNSTTNNIKVFYECDIPIPINYFNFSTYGTDLFSNSNALLYLKCNDEISIVLNFDNSVKFLSQYILNVNPNVTSIFEFGFLIYDTYSTSGLSLQNNSWSSYSSLCNFHIVFDNYYGDSIWQSGYDDGFRAGQAAADEGLRNNNITLQNQVNDLSNQVESLTSRVNQQSDIINQLNNELQSSSNNFKGLFFTFADIPFRTVSNALGFEFWGVNLFRFFVGIITALGILWLIKRLYK